MSVIIQKIVVSLIVVIIPALFKNVFINETVLEYALFTRKEKEQKRIFNDIVAIIILFGMMIAVRFSILFNAIVVSAEIAKIIAEVCLSILLVGIFVSTIMWLVKFKTRKVTNRKDHQETDHKKASRWQMIFTYIFILSAIGVPFIFYQVEFKTVEVAIFMYIALVVVFCLRGFIYTSNGIDRAIVFFEERVYSEISGKEELKRVYVYHKVENDYLLCGEEIEMDKPTRVIEVKEFLKSGFYYVR